MTTPGCPSCAGGRFLVEVISHAVWLCFRFPLKLRMVGELRAARNILSAHDGISNLFLLLRRQVPAVQCRAARLQALQVWAEVTGVTAQA